MGQVDWKVFPLSGSPVIAFWSPPTKPLEGELETFEATGERAAQI